MKFHQRYPWRSTSLSLTPTSNLLLQIWSLLRPSTNIDRIAAFVWKRKKTGSGSISQFVCFLSSPKKISFQVRFPKLVSFPLFLGIKKYFWLTNCVAKRYQMSNSTMSSVGSSAVERMPHEKEFEGLSHARCWFCNFLYLQYCVHEWAPCRNSQPFYLQLKKANESTE